METELKKGPGTWLRRYHDQNSRTSRAPARTAPTAHAITVGGTSPALDRISLKAILQVRRKPRVSHKPSSCNRVKHGAEWSEARHAAELRECVSERSLGRREDGWELQHLMSSSMFREGEGPPRQQVLIPKRNEKRHGCVTHWKLAVVRQLSDSLQPTAERCFQAMSWYCGAWHLSRVLYRLRRQRSPLPLEVDFEH